MSVKLEGTGSVKGPAQKGRPGRRDLREMGVIGKWWKGEKRSEKEMEERKRKVIANGAEGKQCQE